MTRCACDQRAVQVLLVQVVILAQTRGDDFFQIKPMRRKIPRFAARKRNWKGRTPAVSVKELANRRRPNRGAFQQKAPKTKAAGSVATLCGFEFTDRD